MSFAPLRDIFSGRLGAEESVRKLLLMKSPANATKYLIDIQRRAFSGGLPPKKGDDVRNERWEAYPSISGVRPIREKDLGDHDFLAKQATKLSFDISRFTEFIVGYTRVDEDIKPIMLHYGMIYLFDFFSRTWLKYGRNWGHGMKLVQEETGYGIKIQKSGIFQRAVDAFYFCFRPSLFSLDKEYGIHKNGEREYIVQAKKMK